MLLLPYVDDVLHVGHSDEVKLLEQELQQRFKLKMKLITENFVVVTLDQQDSWVIYKKLFMNSKTVVSHTRNY